MATWSKRQFEDVAEILEESWGEVDPRDIEYFIRKFAELFRWSNERFDEAKFRMASHPGDEKDA